MRIGIMAGALALWASPALAQCEAPAPVADYLKAHPGWSILTAARLTAGNAKQWDESHKGLCPGLAPVVVDGGGKTSYALALLSTDGRRERIVLLKAGAKGFKEVELSPESPSIDIVVYRVPPGRAEDPETGKPIAIAHDSIMCELFEAAAQQFYFAGGKLRVLQQGD